MSTTDYLVLVGIAVTALGWLVTFLRQMAIAQAQARFNGDVQKQLEAMKEEFALAREHRQFVVPTQLAEMQRVGEWLQTGYRLGQELHDHVLNIENREEPEWHQENERLGCEKKLWEQEYHHCYSIILQYESLIGRYD